MHAMGKYGQNMRKVGRVSSVGCLVDQLSKLTGHATRKPLLQFWRTRRPVTVTPIMMKDVHCIG